MRVGFGLAVWNPPPGCETYFTTFGLLRHVETLELSSYRLRVWKLGFGKWEIPSLFGLGQIEHLKFCQCQAYLRSPSEAASVWLYCKGFLNARAASALTTKLRYVDCKHAMQYSGNMAVRWKREDIALAWIPWRRVACL